MFVADALSRAFIKTDSPIDEELEYTVHSLSLTVPMSNEKKVVFQTAVTNDPILSQIKYFLLNSWPKLKNLDSDLKYYFNLKDNIYLSDNLLFYNNKILVPTVLCKEMLSLLHSAHFGIQKTKLRARQVMFWPKMSQDIESFIANCETCQMNKPANPKETLMSHEIPERPWQYLFSDFFHYNGNDYLLIVDSYSHWFEVFPTKDKTAKTVVQCCKQLFSQFGVPDIFYADNNPFNSVYLKEFARLWNFELQFSSPHHHQSNGMAEKYVNIAKNMLKKMRHVDELSYYLLEYRNTPLPSIGYAPAELMLNRLVKTKLPITMENLLPKIPIKSHGSNLVYEDLYVDQPQIMRTNIEQTNCNIYNQYYVEPEVDPMSNITLFENTNFEHDITVTSSDLDSEESFISIDNNDSYSDDNDNEKLKPGPDSNEHSESDNTSLRVRSLSDSDTGARMSKVYKTHSASSISNLSEFDMKSPTLTFTRFGRKVNRPKHYEDFHIY